MLSGLFSDLAGSVVLRAACAAALSLLIVLWAIPRLCRAALRRRFGEREGKTFSERLNELHAEKRSTPIVGGIGILGGAVGAGLLFADLSSASVWLLLAVILLLGLLGFADDYAKTFGQARTSGLTPRQKLAGQAILGLTIGLFLLARAHWGPAGALDRLTRLEAPFLDQSLGIGALGFLLLSVFLVTGTSNAVNLTDGLDGLAGGCALVAFGVYLVVAVLTGDPSLASSFGLTPVAGAGEVGVVLAALAGGLTGFLWFNRHPARVFMGDTGSLPLGGVLAVAALLTEQVLLLAVVGGVFVAEALSVILQVGCYKLTGRRVFLIAPLHHHFQFKGWHETQIVDRFHAAALLLGILGLAGLGLGP